LNHHHMRFDDRFIDEIKSRLRLSDVIGKTVKLRRQGREYVGLSPFNKEKTPSFYVNDDKGFYHDFSSGKNGDLISFLQETERLSFVEAVERLAAEAGVPLPALDPRAAVIERERESLSDWLELAAKWFEGELRRPVGTEARAYLDRRGLPETEWARFRLGFSPPGRTGLKDYLITKGARPSELVEAGLLIAPEDGGQPYDRFRARIIFPIADARGRVVSFGGRALDPQARAKYLNGPETPLFHKGGMLYGLSEARKLLATGEDGAPLVVVEGYMDVIACQRAGVAAVAPLGTALTEDQMEALWRFAPEPILCFDGDNAGQRAASRAIDRALPMLRAGRSLQFSIVSGGKDPDDVLREQGADALKSQLLKTTPFVDALFKREFEVENLDTPERRAAFKGRLRRAAGSIGDRDLAEEYRDALLEKFYSQLRMPRFSRGEKPLDFVDRLVKSVRTSDFPGIKERIRTFSAAIAVGAIDHPEWIRPHFEAFERWGFGDRRLLPLVQPLIDALQEDHVSSDLVLRYVKSDGATKAVERARQFAFEVKGYNFIDDALELKLAHRIWQRCFDAMLELAAIEVELDERRQAFELKEPVVDEVAVFERGRWLRRHQLELLQQITTGSLWRDA
jgi:DNA primase